MSRPVHFYYNAQLKKFWTSPDGVNVYEVKNPWLPFVLLRIMDISILTAAGHAIGERAWVWAMTLIALAILIFRPRNIWG